MEQKFTQELLDYGIPGEDRPLAVNRELIRRKKEAQSGFEVGKGPTLKEIATDERQDSDREEAKKQEEEVSKQKKEFDKLNRKKTEIKKITELDECALRKAEDEAIAQAKKAAASIDPKRFYKNMSTFDKIVGLLGLAAGAYDSFKYGSPNLYSQRLDKEIEKDIKLQKLGLEDEKRKLAASNFKVSTLAKRLARSTKNEQQRMNMTKISLDYGLKAQKFAKEGAKQTQLQQVNYIINNRGITDMELAKYESIFPKLKLRDSMIKGRNGLNYFVRGGVTNLRKVKEYVADTQDSIDGLNDLYSYFDKVSMVNQALPIFSIDAAEAQSLRDRLVGKLRIEFFGPGVMTDNERAQAKKILGDPNALFATDSREKAKVLKIIMKLNYGVRDKLRRDGVAVPKTRNDQVIEQIVRSRKLSDNPKNRRDVINGLIQGEIDAMKRGAKPGSIWNMNETLPI